VPAALRRLVTDMQRRAFELQVDVDAEEEPVGVAPERISAPTVVAVGALDVPDFHAIAADLAAAIPGADRVVAIDGTAHLPALEKPAEVAALVAPVI
jgi:pimeloyl-ACP methyl ester carboxylesterase